MGITDPSALVVVGFVVASSSLISCGGARTSRIAEVRATPRIATTIVASARAAAPATAPDIVRSCAGPRLCREDSIATADPEALTDVEEACARAGGGLLSSPCPRTGASASCSGGTEHGTVTVYVYVRGDEDADAVERVSDQCEALGGRFETLELRIAR